MMLTSRDNIPTIPPVRSSPPPRKPVWSRMANGAVDELISQRFEAVSERAALEALQCRPLGVLRLRLLPKHGGECITQLAVRPSGIDVVFTRISDRQ